MWIITKDNIDNGKNVGARSRSYDEKEFEKKKKAGETCRFRLRDDDHEIYFYGEYDGVDGDESKAFAPLDNFGAAFGCTYMEYYGEYDWMVL